MIATAVRWYVRYRLSAADVRDVSAERQLDVTPRTVLAWAHTFGPLLATEGRRRARPVGVRWHCIELAHAIRRGHLTGNPGETPARPESVSTP